MILSSTGYDLLHESDMPRVMFSLANIIGHWLRERQLGSFGAKLSALRHDTREVLDLLDTLFDGSDERNRLGGNLTEFLRNVVETTCIKSYRDLVDRRCLVEILQSMEDVAELIFQIYGQKVTLETAGLKDKVFCSPSAVKCFMFLGFQNAIVHGARGTVRGECRIENEEFAISIKNNVKSPDQVEALKKSFSFSPGSTFETKSQVERPSGTGVARMISMVHGAEGRVTMSTSSDEVVISALFPLS